MDNKAALNSFDFQLKLRKLRIRVQLGNSPESANELFSRELSRRVTIPIFMFQGDNNLERIFQDVALIDPNQQATNVTFYSGVSFSGVLEGAVSILIASSTQMIF